MSMRGSWPSCTAWLVIENTPEITAWRGDDRGDGREHHERIVKPVRHQRIECNGRLVRIDEQDRTLSEIVEHQRREGDHEPREADRIGAEMAHVGVQRLTTGDSQHHGAERHERGPGFVKEQRQRHRPDWRP